MGGGTGTWPNQYYPGGGGSTYIPGFRKKRNPQNEVGFTRYNRAIPPIEYENGPKLSSTQIDLTGIAAIKVLAAAHIIPDADLHQKGREEQGHVTVRYGLHTANAGDVAKLLDKQGPITFTLGKASYFAPQGKDYDVVKFDVTSPDLIRVNKLLGKLKNAVDQIVINLRQ